ncbi:MAG TPA: hypothetical protein VGG91_00960 [Myxococcaceae bacterium]
MVRPRVSAFLGASLDGFIAEADGGLGFLKPFEQEEHGYADFYASVDTLLMGRKTYETVLGFGAWPFGDRRVAVLSRRHGSPGSTSASSGESRRTCSRRWARRAPATSMPTVERW